MAGRTAVMVAVLGVAGFLVLRRILAPWGVAGTAVAEWMGMLGVPLAWLAGRGGGGRSLLGVGVGGRSGAGPAPGPAGPVRVRRARVWGAAVLVGLAGIPVAWFVTWVQGDWLPPDPSVVEGLRRQLVAGSGPGLVLLLAATALTPAVCEEYLFRGALLNGLLERWPPRAAILLSGLAFGLLHWVPGGGFRILPTAAVGALLGWLAWRTGSVLPSMVGHALHNTLVLVSAAWAARAGRSPVWGVRGGEALPPPLWLALGGVAILMLARHLLRDGAGRGGEARPSGDPPTPGDP